MVHKGDGTNCIFNSSKKGLLLSDVKGNTAHVLINTADMNESKYTVKKYSDANKAWLIQNVIGHPSTLFMYVKI